MNAVLIGLMALLVIAVALMGFWALSQVGFGPADDPSAQDDEDVDTASR